MIRNIKTLLCFQSNCIRSRPPAFVITIIKYYVRGAYAFRLRVVRTVNARRRGTGRRIQSCIGVVFIISRHMTGAVNPKGFINASQRTNGIIRKKKHQKKKTKISFYSHGMKNLRNIIYESRNCFFFTRLNTSFDR